MLKLCDKKNFLQEVCKVKYSVEVEHMCPLAKGAYHGPAAIPQEGKWVQAKEIKDISGLTHGVGRCAPQQRF